MSKARVDVFVLIVQFLNGKWEPCHVIIGFFEIVETFRNAMALQVNEALAKHGFNVQVIAYVKDEACNISTKTIVLTSIASCEVLGLTTPFVGACWGHTMSKCCQYATNDSKVCVGLTSISIKEAQSIL
jgi:methylaspartate ammonia-lyase